MKILRIELNDGANTWYEYSLVNVKSVKIIETLYPEIEELEK